jgi:uncharacterized phiE125 gp8 family phage protein
MPLIAKKKASHGNLIFKVSYDAGTEPITAAEVRAHARIDTTAEDTYLSSRITAVRQMAEKWLGRALITQEITASLDWWPEKGVVYLPRPPLISVISIKTITEAGVKTTYAASNYYTRTDVDPGQIVIKNGCSPPINTDRYYGGYEIVYDAGYGDRAADVPQGIRDGLIEWVSYAYESRTIGREPPEDAMALLGAYRIMRV